MMMNRIGSKTTRLAMLIAITAVTAGAFLRFGDISLVFPDMHEEIPAEFYLFNKTLLFCVVVVTGLMTVVNTIWVLFRKNQTLGDKRVVIVCFLVVLCLGGFFIETDAANKRKNRRYLEYLGNIALQYAEEQGELPEYLSAALDRTGKKLPNRGDADGRGLVYIKLNENEFILRSFGIDGKNNEGGGDDIEVRFIVSSIQNIAD